MDTARPLDRKPSLIFKLSDALHRLSMGEDTVLRVHEVIEIAAITEHAFEVEALALGHNKKSPIRCLLQPTISSFIRIEVDVIELQATINILHVLDRRELTAQSEPAIDGLTVLELLTHEQAGTESHKALVSGDQRIDDVVEDPRCDVTAI